EQPLALEPVEVIAEAVNFMFLCQHRLPFHNLWDSQVVITQFAGQARLILTFEEGTRLSDISPFRKTLAPVRVVFGNGVILRKVKCNKARQLLISTSSLRISKHP